MGKTKTKIIDDSIIEEPVKKTQKPVSKKKVRQKEEDSLVAKLNAELGISEKVSEPEEKKEAEEEISKPRSEQSSHVRGKKYQEAIKDLDRTKAYSIPEAIDIVKKVSYAKFNATLEAHINTDAFGLRGLVSLPYASGKKLKILAFGQGAKNSGADIFGDDETIEEIIQGKVDFDILVTTPEWMQKLAKAAKILGPKGLMPNPKNGTIATSEDGLKKAVESFQAGKTEYRTESKAPVIHISLGKLNQPTEELTANTKIFLQTLGKSKIKKVFLAPTMGPSVKVDLSHI